MPFMQCIVKKHQSVTTSYSTFIHDINYGHPKLCELLQIEFNDNGFVNLRIDAKHGEKGMKNK